MIVVSNYKWLRISGYEFSHKSAMGQKIQRTTGVKLGKADGKFVKEKVDYAIGGIPPVGHNEPLETLLDNDLKNYDIIWAAAGTPFAVFQLKPADLEPLTKGKWIDLSEEI